MSDRLRPGVYTWRAALTESGLPPVTRHVGLVLSLYMSEKGDSAFPGTKRMVADTGLSDRTVRDHLGRLVDAGWLVLVEQGGGRRANSYRAVIPTPAAPAGVDVPSTPVPAAGHPGSTCRAPRQQVHPNSNNQHIDQSLRGERRVDRPQRGSRVPEPFDVTEAMQTWVLRECPQVDWRTATRAFIDYWVAVPGQRGVKLDWPATWRNWMRNEQKRAHR